MFWQVFLSIILTSYSLTIFGKNIGETPLVSNQHHNFKSVLYCKIAGMDPLWSETDCDMIVQNQIFETLFEISPNKLSIRPLLAKSFTYSDNLLRYTITLKDGVRFHDNTVMNADDVLFTFSRIAKERPDKIGFLSSSDGCKKNCLSGIKKIDDKTIEFTLKQPNSLFIYSLADLTFSILPKSQKEALKSGLFKNNPVGTGAFKFINYIDQYGLKLTRFEQYHQQLPEITELTFPVLSEDEAKKKFIKGELDQLFPYRLSPTEVKQSVPFQEVKYRVFYTIKFNPTFYPHPNNPFLSLDNRKAFRQALNLSELHKEIQNPILEVADGFIPFGMPGYSKSSFELLPKDIFEKNLSQLRKHAFVISCSSGVDEIKLIVKQLENAFRKYKLNVKFKIEEVKSVFEGTKNGSYLGSITSNFYRYPDTLSILEQVDKFGYTSKIYSLLLDSARKEADKEKRAQIYYKANAFITSDVAVIPFFHGGKRTGLFSKKWVIPKLDYVGELFMKYRYITLRK